MMMIRTILLCTCLCYGMVNAQKIKRIDGTKYSSDSLTAKIRSLMDVANVAGVSVTVFNDNKAVYAQTFGYADVKAKLPFNDSVALYACSFAKTVFAYMVMQLVDEKLIDLDKPLVSYLQKDLTDYVIPVKRRGYQDLKEDERYKKITARMCLTHTTGFPNWRWFEPDKKIKIKFEPGTRYSYSGEGLYLLQFIIEQITGKDYETLSRERVFQPLGMLRTSQVWQNSFNTNTCYGHDDKGNKYELNKWKDANAGGSMTTTPKDFTTFFTALIQGKGISKGSFKAMTNTQVNIRSRAQFGPFAWVDSTDNDAIKLGYGLGVGVFHTPYGRAFFKEGHDEGWGHYSITFPDKKIGIIIMTNNDNGESIFKELLEYAIGDKYTPWQWENYIPYQLKGKQGN